MQEAKFSACIAPDHETPCRKALLLATGIHSVARLALAVTGSDISNMSDDLIVDLESSMDEVSVENALAQCLEIIERANRHMLSVIIKRGNSNYYTFVSLTEKNRAD